jgi:hypothetical protein
MAKPLEGSLLLSKNKKPLSNLKLLFNVLVQYLAICPEKPIIPPKFERFPVKGNFKTELKAPI